MSKVGTNSSRVITSAEMRAVESAAIASGKVSGIELMERAGRGVIEAVFEEWPELATGRHSAAVLCGSGNNGGDGFVVARLLKQAGWEVDLFFYGRSETLPPDAKENFARWLVLGDAQTFSFPTITNEEKNEFQALAYGSDGVDLVVDAVFGIGLSRGATGLKSLFSASGVGLVHRKRPVRHVSVDIPSGMFADMPQHREYFGCMLADLTVTFHALKPAHLDKSTAPSCGHVVVKDIGL